MKEFYQLTPELKAEWDRFLFSLPEEIRAVIEKFALNKLYLHISGAIGCIHGFEAGKMPGEWSFSIKVVIGPDGAPVRMANSYLIYDVCPDDLTEYDIPEDMAASLNRPFDPTISTYLTS